MDDVDIIPDLPVNLSIGPGCNLYSECVLRVVMLLAHGFVAV